MATGSLKQELQMLHHAVKKVAEELRTESWFIEELSRNQRLMIDQNDKYLKATTELMKNEQFITKEMLEEHAKSADTLLKDYVERVGALENRIHAYGKNIVDSARNVRTHVDAVLAVPAVKVEAEALSPTLKHAIGLVVHPNDGRDILYDLLHTIGARLPKNIHVKIAGTIRSIFDTIPSRFDPDPSRIVAFVRHDRTADFDRDGYFKRHVGADNIMVIRLFEKYEQGDRGADDDVIEYDTTYWHPSNGLYESRHNRDAWTKPSPLVMNARLDAVISRIVGFSAAPARGYALGVTTVGIDDDFEKTVVIPMIMARMASENVRVEELSKMTTKPTRVLCFKRHGKHWKQELAIPEMEAIQLIANKFGSVNVMLAKLYNGPPVRDSELVFYYEKDALSNTAKLYENNIAERLSEVEHFATEGYGATLSSKK